MKGDIRQLAFPGYELADYVKESIAFLQEHEPPEGFFSGFSGGKDSIVTIELLNMAGVRYEAFYTCTRIDPPEILRFIKRYYPNVIWLYPETTMYKAIQYKSPPLRMQRWCCDVLKKDPSKKCSLKNRVMGIRAEESVKRAKRPRIDKFYGQTTYKPIFKWPEWAIWEFIEQRGLPYPTLYDEGFGRIGCIVCPFILGSSEGKTTKRSRSMSRWPGIWKAYEHAVKRWFISKCFDVLRDNQQCETPEEYWQAYLNGFEVKNDTSNSPASAKGARRPNNRR